MYVHILQVFRKFVRALETGDHAWKGYLWVALLFITATAQENIVVNSIYACKIYKHRFHSYIFICLY